MDTTPRRTMPEAVRTRGLRRSLEGLDMILKERADFAQNNYFFRRECRRELNLSEGLGDTR
jgi:hypothetical protein